MQKFIYLIDRMSGRIVMLNRQSETRYSYTFLVNSDRAARVVFDGITGDDVLHINLLMSELVIRAGVLAALGMLDKRDAVRERLALDVERMGGRRPSVWVEA